MCSFNDIQLPPSQLNVIFVTVPRVYRKALTGCPVPIFSYFFLFFEHIPIFSYLLNETSYFSYFLAGEANVSYKIENEIMVMCFR